MNRKEILEAAAKTVCIDRQDAYGKPEDNFELIASLWGHTSVKASLQRTWL